MTGIAVLCSQCVKRAKVHYVLTIAVPFIDGACELCGEALEQGTGHAIYRHDIEKVGA